MAYNTSLFAQLLHIVPRSTFDRLVRQTKADRYCKSFTTWHQCVAMLYLHFAQAKSLREISDGLRSCGGKLSHLGISAPAHSTLAHATRPVPPPCTSNSFTRCSSAAMPSGAGSGNSNSRIHSTALTRPPSTCA